MKIIAIASLLALTATASCLREEVPVTREVAVTHEVEVTRETEVTREVEVTRETEVTREVEVTRAVEVTREVEVTRAVEVTREVEVTPPLDLCDDYPYIVAIAHSMKRHHDALVAGAIERSRSRIVDIFFYGRQQAAHDAWSTTADFMIVCPDTPRRTDEPYEMKTFVGWAVCRHALNMAYDLYRVDDALGKFDIEVQNSTRRFVLDYVNYCDNDYFDEE